jgi:hypothetical protein
VAEKEFRREDRTSNIKERVGVTSLGRRDYELG